jgi:hypothetical protein
VQPPPKGTPSEAQLTQCNLVHLVDVAQAELAEKNNWSLWYYSTEVVVTGHFYPQIDHQPTGCALYANKDYIHKRPSEVFV